MVEDSKRRRKVKEWRGESQTLKVCASSEQSRLLHFSEVGGTESVEIHLVISAAQDLVSTVCKANLK